jgi:hypothetical protein
MELARTGNNIQNKVVVEEGYIRVTMRIGYKDIWIRKQNRSGQRGQDIGVVVGHA